MKQLRLRKEHFQTLDTKSDEYLEQYTNVKDCPIARVLKERFPKQNVLVGPGYASLGKTTIYSGNFYLKFLAKAAEKLANGAKYAIINI